MSIPRLKRTQGDDSSSAARDFWAAARLCDTQIGGAKFASPLSQFGFLETSASTVLDILQKAMRVMHKLLPWPVETSDGSMDSQDYYQSLLGKWKDSSRFAFWLHSSGDSCAVTSDHHFSRPYGDESATLFHLAAPTTSDEARNRQLNLMSLNAAQRTPRAHPQFSRYDNFNARGDGISGTYRFTKSHGTTGRDRIDNLASGVTLPEKGPRQLGTPSAPFVYLHLSSAYLAV